MNKIGDIADVAAADSTVKVLLEKNGATIVMEYDISGVSDQEVRLASRITAANKEKALWLLEKLVPKSGINNIGSAILVDGRWRSDALRTSIAILLGRYEILRTVFIATDAELVKELVPVGEFKVEIEQIELSGGHLEKDLSAFVGRPFDLDGGPLLRAGLAAHPDGDIFCLAVHHLVFDGISIAIFMRALIPVYDAVTAGRPVPPEVPMDRSLHREPEPRAADLTYWRENLHGFVPDSLDLWCDSPNVSHPLMSGETVTHMLSAEARSAVQRLQREVRAPVAAVLLAAYYALLASHGAGPDLVVGSPLDVRGPQSSSAIGYHVNAVPLRLRVDFAEGFRQLARRARDVFLAAMAHAHVSVDDLSAELPRTGSSWQTTLYRHLFNYLPEMDSGDFVIDGMTARPRAIENGFSKFDLELYVMPSRAEIRFRYRTEILAPADVEALLRRYEGILIAAAQDADRALGELAGWSELDHKTIDAANETARQIESATVVAAFRSQVLASPEAPAVVDDEYALTYGQAWEAAGAVRDLLKSYGVGAGDVVAVVVPRSREVVVGAFGVWLAGATYLPLDAEQDASLLARLLTHSKAKAVLTGSGVRLKAGEGLPPVLPLSAATAKPIALDGPSEVDPLAPACLIYVREQAGQPVATLLSHQGIANMVSHFARELAVGPATGTLALACFSSFGSLLELFLPLISGGRVIVAPNKSQVDGDALRETIERHHVGVVQVPPGVPARILEDVGDRLSGLRIVARAEEMSPALARRLLAAGCQLHAVYGGAETTGWAMSGRIDGEIGLTSGRPIANTRAFVVAPDGRELPIGVRGELCIAGSGIALGHQDDPRFPRSVQHGRHHRTGELARWRPDGTVERLGQIRRQATIAGSRVNLSEVDAVLLDQHGVSAAVALTVKSSSGGDILVAFAEVSGEAAAADRLAERLREHALASLPPTAVPQRVICVDALPPGAAGHVDHDALALLALERLNDGPDRQGVNADDPLLPGLLGLWQRLLKVDVTAQTSFFTAGGHSLLGAKLAQDVEELTGIHLELSEIFSHPTPITLAARLRAIDTEAANHK